MCRWTEEEIGLTVRLLLHGLLAGFFNMPVQASKRGHRKGVIFFMVIPRNCPISLAFYDAYWDREDLFSS